MFRQNKSTIKNLGCGLQEKYLRTRHNFGSKSVKYLGEEGIKKFKYTLPQTAKGGNQLVRASGKQNIQMRTAAQMGGKELRTIFKRSSGQMQGKELGSLINMVSKSKPQLPFLVGGGLYSLNEFNLVPTNNNIPKLGEKEAKLGKLEIGGSIYEGHLIDKTMHGKGKLTFPDGNIYEGDFFNNKIQGKGKISFPDGSFYEGDYQDNLQHGKGKLFSVGNGNNYEGEFWLGVIEGKGKMTFKNGEIYEGLFSNNKFEGKGKFTFKSGTVYEGDYRDGKMSGKGKYKYENECLARGILKKEGFRRYRQP